MQSKTGAGIVGGLVGGVAFGIMMTMMKAPAPGGMEMPMMAMVAKVVRSDSLVVGWLYHLFNSAVIGGLFGLVLGNRLTGKGSGVVWGMAYGAFWWVLGGLILMPMLLGMPAFAQFKDPAMTPVAWGSLVGHLVFGALLGLVTAAASRPSGGLAAPR